ncbi:hypothetical protein J6590_037090 [Homalodisca vitripennis]|nr:hypothetical protein J6590_037090 [Homalodisca vitripennis]
MLKRSQHTSSANRCTVVEDVERVAESISEPHHSCKWTVEVIAAMAMAPAEQITRPKASDNPGTEHPQRLTWRSGMRSSVCSPPTRACSKRNLDELHLKFINTILMVGRSDRASILQELSNKARVERFNDKSICITTSSPSAKTQHPVRSSA